MSGCKLRAEKNDSKKEGRKKHKNRGVKPELGLPPVHLSKSTLSKKHCEIVENNSLQNLLSGEKNGYTKSRSSFLKKEKRHRPQL